MIKSKTESPTNRLKTPLLKLSEYAIDLKYQKGSEMHTSDALSRLQNITDTPDNKDIIPLNFLQHFTPTYIEHAYSHLVENLYIHKTKLLDTIQVKRKCSRPPKAKLENPIQIRIPQQLQILAPHNCKATKSLDNDIASRELVKKINAELEKSDRLLVTKLNTASKLHKQDYKSKIMTEKYSLLPMNPQ